MTSVPHPEQTGNRQHDEITDSCYDSPIRNTSQSDVGTKCSAHRLSTGPEDQSAFDGGVYAHSIGLDIGRDNPLSGYARISRAGWIWRSGWESAAADSLKAVTS